MSMIRRLRLLLRRPAVLAVLVVAAASAGCDENARQQGGTDGGRPLPAGVTVWGFTPFPYDMTREALDRTHRIVAEHGTLYALHFDNGVPWAEAHAGKAFPEPVREEWRRLVDRKPKGHYVYLALAPLADDRFSLAPACEGSSVPEAIDGAAMDSDAVRNAWLNYARRAVETFRPDVLNLGIEAGELAAKSPTRWREFVGLYRHTRDALKKTCPKMKIGISFSLHQMMLKDGVADRAGAIMDRCDYLGLSFYPHASSFHEAMGSKPLPAAPDQWRKPLAWARKFTDKPLVLCETGYSTVDVSVPRYGIRMTGSAELQRRYVEDLAEIAARDGWLAVVWFMPVDCDALHARLPEGDGVIRIWQNIGLWDPKLRPKPALKAWDEAVRAAREAEAPKATTQPAEDAKTE